MESNWGEKNYVKYFEYLTESGSELLDIILINDKMKVLDLGCGPGTLTKKIYDMGAKVIGVDSEPDFFDFAKSNYPEV